ncbi:pleckstrin homology domain-containing family G member 5-like isoform X3 [Physella acuta]|uniref:pleckstrin homology domain-containing family G member 5-like isoform X3 n=1 Tax=Physella acuta TaxID=109671 RepID=UPI0027DD4937|nr:pleckstrin homology domain-containing family G member 5-like isoform X3 [Physella acuta]XP_059178766.1 pleckstrin homology domain-containing family G member 5-like isoform X3 [Physella acuta]XP_059178767.1 pleckstrin homology domain-containing family G member 5-like isoform X3 [Physella acuta]
MKESLTVNMLKPSATEVVKRRSVRSNANVLNRRSWPLAPGSIKQQLKDRERQDQLTEILNRYSTNGFPPLPDLLGRPKFDENVLTMELNWRLLVDGDENMTKKQQEHQEAVWELLQTEVSYIKQIRVIIDVFQNCLFNVKLEQLLNDIETENLFSNIHEIFECNCTFWQQHLLPVLHNSRETRKPLDPLIMKEGFVDHFQKQFQVYFKYFIEHKKCLDYAKQCMENSDLFKTFIMWAEAQKQCNRLKLADILVKPMQRLLKYSLLLQAILKHTENENDRADIKEMIQSVEKLCCAANVSLQRKDDYEKLEAIRKTLEPYDSLETPNDECAKLVQEHNNSFNILAPIPGVLDGLPRCLLFQSSLRMKEAQTPKLDVECLLFTDLILICKPNRKADRFKIIRPPMRLDQLVVSELKDKGSFLLIYINEYSVPISAFTFHSETGAIRGWLEKFREAQKDFKARRISGQAELKRLAADAAQAQEEMDSLTSVSSDLDLKASVFPRSDSMESADHFMPNLLTPEMNNDGAVELGRSGSTGDIHTRVAPGHRDLVHNNTDPKLTNSDDSPSESRPSNNLNLGTKHKPVQTCRSVPNINVGLAHINNSSPTNKPKLNGNSDNCIAEDMDSLIPSAYTAKDTYTHEQSITGEEDPSKQKLNARRSSRTEKRYHTVDSIQDMKISEKDSTIHKRLSWRTDVDQTRNLGSKAVSSDSVQSYPSSSGVSSSASLHFNIDSDISEETEFCFLPGKTGETVTHTERHKLFSVGVADDSNETDDTDLTDLDPKSKSKSTPDLVTMFNNSLHVSPMQDGIASVAMTMDGLNIKLTQAEILKRKQLKHQILYDASIESSEV